MVERIRSREHAEGYIAKVCFKHGPPERYGLELEWTVHHESDFCRPVELGVLRQALGPHAPPTLDPASPHSALAAGSRVTVEPGGQIELSTPPTSAVGTAIDAARTDACQVTSRLAAHGLVLGQRGADAFRDPRRILRTARYDALEASFDRVGPFGRQMMSATASMQICVDAGERHQLATRWEVLHAIGPALVGLFANSPILAGRRTDWASARLRAVLAMAPPATTPPTDLSDPVGHWTRLALTAPLSCLRSGQAGWIPPAGLTFADWITAGRSGGLPAPTEDDLAYHLTTMFPVVRPRGYLEVRYLDQQPGDDWVAPFVLVAALLSNESHTDHALDAAAPATGRWFEAARDGLADPFVHRAASDLAEVGLTALAALELDSDAREAVIARLGSLVDTRAARKERV